MMPFLLFAFVASITPGPTNIPYFDQQPALWRESHASRPGKRLPGGQRHRSGLGCRGRGGAAPVSAGASGDELGGGAVAELDELAAVLRPGGQFIWPDAEPLYRSRGRAVAGDKPQNLDDGTGGGEPVRPGRKGYAARGRADGALFSGYLCRLPACCAGHGWGGPQTGSFAPPGRWCVFSG